MGQRRRVSQREPDVAAEENMESPSSGENLQSDGKSLHEMETQIVGLEEEETGCSTPCENVSLSSSPLLEGRRTRSGKSLDGTGECTTKVRKEKRVKAKVLKFKRGLKTFSSPQQKVALNMADKKTNFAHVPSSEKRDNSPKSGVLLNTRTDDKDNEDTNTNIPLVDFMANFDASPSSSSKNVQNNKLATLNSTSEQKLENPSTVCPKSVETLMGTEGAVDKLRSSVVDGYGQVLAKSYRKSLRDTEEYALNFISEEFHHPVITCFRELTSTDISHIVRSNKLKKSCNNLEQSIIYLGLIDLLATVNNNPVYGETETSKLSKNLSSSVKKVLLEFKNIMGTWALSCNEQLSNRYTLILNYLRTLVPMFKKAGFDQELGNILDCIEREVNRHKQNQEKIKAMSGTSRGTENSNDKKPSASSTDSQDGESRSALNEIILNVDLNVKIDESDDDEEEVSVLKEEKALQIFGKPLKGSPRSSDLIKKRSKTLKTKLDSGNNETFKSPTSTTQLKRHNDKTPKSHLTSKKASLVPPKKTLSNSPNTAASKTESNTGKTLPVKRIANDDLKTSNETTKKRKIEVGSSTPKLKSNEGKLNIKSFFQSVNSPSESSARSPSVVHTSEKPTVNAFALMMNKSREIALKKKTDKMNAVTVPSLKVNAVKS